MLHVWMDEWADLDEWKEAVVRLKEQGKVRSFGLSLVFPLEDIHVPQKAIETGLSTSARSSTISTSRSPKRCCSLWHRRTMSASSPAARWTRARCTGKITPDTTFPEDDWRNDYFGGERKDAGHRACQGAGLAGRRRRRVAARSRAALLLEPSGRLDRHRRHAPTRARRSNALASDKGPCRPRSLSALRSMPGPTTFGYRSPT